MAHKLLIDIQDSTNDNKYIHVRDYSIWDPVLEVRDRLFQVLPPYADQYYKIPVSENSLISVSSTMLGLPAEQDIPDGAYLYHYSVSPNNQVFISSCHYRVAVMMNKVLNKMGVASLNNSPSIDDCGNIEIEKDQTVLLHIWMLLNSAASAGKYSHLKARADELYTLALREFSKLYEVDSPCTTC